MPERQCPVDLIMEIAFTGKGRCLVLRAFPINRITLTKRFLKRYLTCFDLPVRLISKFMRFGINGFGNDIKIP